MVSLGNLDHGTRAVYTLTGKVRNNLSQPVANVRLRFGAVYPSEGLVRTTSAPVLLVKGTIPPSTTMPFRVSIGADTKAGLAPPPTDKSLESYRYETRYPRTRDPIETWAHIEYPKVMDIVISWRQPSTWTDNEINSHRGALISAWNLCTVGDPTFQRAGAK